MSFNKTITAITITNPMIFCIVFSLYCDAPKYDPVTPPTATDPIKGKIKSVSIIPDCCLAVIPAKELNQMKVEPAAADSFSEASPKIMTID